MYKAMLFLHILCAIVGFGYVTLASIGYRRVGALRGSDALESYRTVDTGTRVAEWFIYGVFVFGFLAAVAAPGGMSFAFKQWWLSVSMLLYIVALVLSLALLQPGGRKMGRLLEQAAQNPSPELGAQLEAQGKRQGMVSGILHLLFVVVLILMVFKPGG